MKKVLVTAQIIFLLNVINPYLAQATFPGENIIFGNRGQSNEQNNETFAFRHFMEIRPSQTHLEPPELVEPNKNAVAGVNIFRKIGNCANTFLQVQLVILVKTDSVQP